MKHMWDIINNSPILSNLTSAILYTVLISWLFINYIKTPDIKLIPTYVESPAPYIAFCLRNNKNFISYDTYDIYYKFFVPLELFVEFNAATENKYQIAESSYESDTNYRRPETNKPIVHIKEKPYFAISGICKVKIFPKSETIILKVKGPVNLNKSKEKFYYTLSTKYGRLPSKISHLFKSSSEILNQDIIKDVTEGKIPHAILEL